jgi:hypothetical protein
MEKNDQNLPDFERIFFKLPVLWLNSTRESRIQNDSVLFLLSYLLCSQIWLNYFVNDDHFGYVTKSLKKTLVQDVKHVQNSQKAMLEDMFNL